ncbi:MAG: DUF2812 domain-containing protein [Bacillota bacterium]|nr:DUF2812 domain-containing protein [Bacillota bacterium]
MKVCKFFIDYDKEEKWLNEMAKRGYELKNAYNGLYEFHFGKPEDAIIRIDYRNFKSQVDFNDYCALFEDSGWKHEAGSKRSGNQYFKKIDQNGNDDIFSDTASRAGKYKRVSSMWMSLAVSYITISVSLMITNHINFSSILHPERLYYTPGLWEMKGLRFLGAFLFETPFAIMRGFSWLIFIIFIILYLAFSIKTRILYKNLKHNNY